MEAKAKRLEDESHPNQVQVADVEPDRLDGVPLRAPNTMAEQFPVDLTKKDPKDEIMSLKMAAITKDGITPMGKVEATDEDFKWLAKKAAQREEADFQRYFAQEFDKMDPARKKVARELFPAFYAQREALLKDEVKLLEKIARIKLRGIQTYEDLFLQYMLDTGRLDTTPLQSLLYPEKTIDKAKQAKFKRGLLNPWRVYGDVPLPNTDGKDQFEAVYPGRPRTYPGDFVQPLSREAGELGWAGYIGRNGF